MKETKKVWLVRSHKRGNTMNRTTKYIEAVSRKQLLEKVKAEGNIFEKAKIVYRGDIKLFKKYLSK